MFSELSCKAHNFIRITFPLLMLLSSTQAVHAAFTIEQVLSEPYFDASDIKKVRKGGSGKGLFEGNVVPGIEDLEGRQLAQAVTTMQRHDIAAEGVWQTRITVPQPAPKNIRLIAFSPSPKEGDAAITSAPVLPGVTGQTALELGRKVLAVREAIQNPGMPNAMQAVTDLGHDQRYYVMVRGWLSYQLQGDMSILDANREQTRDEVRLRINFIEKAIRAIDLE